MLHEKVKFAQDNTDDPQEPWRPDYDIFQVVEEEELNREMEEIRKIQKEIEERRRAQEAAEARAKAEAEEQARLAEEERLRAIEEKRRRNYIEWFDMTITEIMELIQHSDLDKHMSDLVKIYQTASKAVTPNASEIYHALNKIKANHLIFTRLSRNAFKFLFEKGMIFTVEAGKYVYKKQRTSKNNIYFVLSGELEYQLPPPDSGRFGERVSIGFSVGEEMLFENPPPKSRYESLVAVTTSTLLQLDAKDLKNLGRTKDGGGSSNFREDRDILMDLCKQFYFMKTLWRSDEGLVEIPAMMEPWLAMQEARAQAAKLKNSPTNISGLINGLPSTSNLKSLSGASSSFPLNIRARARRVTIGRPTGLQRDKSLTTNQKSTN